MQVHVGRSERLEIYARKAILPYMTEQLQAFFSLLPFLVVGSIDAQGKPWATLLSGEVGFAHAPEPATLRVDAMPNLSDPLHSAITQGAPLGLLGIELNTRRRNRMSATVSASDETGFSLAVTHAYGNCPKYIQVRAPEFIREPNAQAEPIVPQPFTDLNDSRSEFIRQADTFFVSSYHLDEVDNPDANGVDVSHRGGEKGFVKVDGNTLTIPDYVGNNIFNTIGNFLLNPKAGLVFPDFTNGNLLMMTGTVEILWDDDPEIMTMEGAKRAWRFTLDHGMLLKDALPFRA